jgi:hypothetical protein
MCSTNPSHFSEETKCNSTCVDKTHSMPTRTQNASHHKLTNSLPFQRGYKKHQNMCGPKPSNTSENTRCISTCVDQAKFISTCVDLSHPRPARTQYSSQLVLPNPIPCQKTHKMHLNLC